MFIRLEKSKVSKMANGEFTLMQMPFVICITMAHLPWFATSVEQPQLFCILYFFLKVEYRFIQFLSQTNSWLAELIKAQFYKTTWLLQSSKSDNLMELTIYSLTQTSAINPMSISVFLLNWLHLTFEALELGFTPSPQNLPMIIHPTFYSFSTPYIQSSPCTRVAISILFHHEHGLTDTNGGWYNWGCFKKEVNWHNIASNLTALWKVFPKNLKLVTPEVTDEG